MTVPETLSAKWGPLLTAKEVAGCLRCSVDKVYDLVEAGRLRGFCLSGEPYVRKGRRGKKGLRILGVSVEEFITAALAATAKLSHMPKQPEPEQAAPRPSLPRPNSSQSGRSRVVLPYPGRSRAESTSALPSSGS